MATLLLVEQQDATRVKCYRIGLHERALAHFKASHLDIVLANGGDPDSSAALSLRAHALISSTTRSELSRTIRRILRGAERPHHPFDATTPVCRRKILEAKAELEQLAENLRRPGPVDARGVAQARLLLRDGSGPIYSRPHANDLQQPLQAAIDALETCL